MMRIASALRAALPRKTDFIARYGGEEFSAILPATDTPGAGETARRICAAVADLDLHHSVPSSRRVTVSVGFSTYHGSSQQSAVELLRAADHGLYNAKRLGRHRCEFVSIETVARIERLNSSPETPRGQQEESLTLWSNCDRTQWHKLHPGAVIPVGSCNSGRYRRRGLLSLPSHAPEYTI